MPGSFIGGNSARRVKAAKAQQEGPVLKLVMDEEVTPVTEPEPSPEPEPEVVLPNGEDGE